MISKTTKSVRSLLYAIGSNVSLFLAAAFVCDCLLRGSLFAPYGAQVILYYDYVIVPWGMALCLLRLERSGMEREPVLRWDTRILFVLLGWIVLPFALRFGVDKVNVSSWFRHAVVFFGVYATVAEADAAQREKWMDWACALFSLLAFILGTALLFCAWNVRTFMDGWGDYGFGVCNGIYLCSGVHYNTTAMACVCLLMMSLAGCARQNLKWLRALCAASAFEMAAVVVLTQSRTSRYAMIAALALGMYSRIACGKWHKHATLRHVGGLLAAVMAAVGLYQGAALFNDTMIAHYNQVNHQRMLALEDGLVALPFSVARAAAQEEIQVQPVAVPQLEARKAIDSTFSDRTNIWKNIFSYWKANPKNLLIGNGAGRSMALIVKGTIHEARGYVPMHNAYLQYAADYGLIAFALLCAFLLCKVKPVLCAFFAPTDMRRGGDLALCLLVLVSLATGLMESNPLEMFSPMNMTFFFALAMLSNGDRKTL